jgi:hypothetical protein
MSFDEVMQHATVAQDNEALIEAIPVAIGLVKNFLSPISHRVAYLAS